MSMVCGPRLQEVHPEPTRVLKCARAHSTSTAGASLRHVGREGSGVRARGPTGASGTSDCSQTGWKYRRFRSTSAGWALSAALGHALWFDTPHAAPLDLTLPARAAVCIFREAIHPVQILPALYRTIKPGALRAGVLAANGL